MCVGGSKRRQGEGRKGEVGVSHRSCIVNEKFFTNQILFHRRPAEKAYLMVRWMDDICDGRMLPGKPFHLSPGSRWFECNSTFRLLRNSGKERLSNNSGGNGGEMMAIHTP